MRNIFFYHIQQGMDASFQCVSLCMYNNCILKNYYRKVFDGGSKAYFAEQSEVPEIILPDTIIRIPEKNIRLSRILSLYLPIFVNSKTYRIMTKRESITRHNLIISKVKRTPCSFEEISDYLERESEIQAYDFTISKRTFQRDLNDIRSIYNIDIRYDIKRRVYYVELDQSSEINERLLEAFDTFNALNVRENLADYIHLEKRRPQGTENLYGLLHAIRNRLQISFVHHKFWEDNPTVREVHPYALKEFRNRWYIMGKNLSDNQIKSFALDRLTDLDITTKKFGTVQDFDMHKHFKYCFGIISPNNKEPEEIILSFTPLQGKYVKTLPLHETQEIITDDENELRIKLTLFITHDLLMEILSFGDSVEVIEPPHLIEEIVSTYKSALKQYKRHHK